MDSKYINTSKRNLTEKSQIETKDTITVTTFLLALANLILICLIIRKVIER
jgi:uncharacterized membrane protein